jgi:lysophospholipase L1-like esterase
MNRSLGWSLVCYFLLFVCAGVLTACGGGGGGGSSSFESNVAPVANNDTGTVSEGGTTTVNVAANDTAADAALDLASIQVVSSPSNGSAVVNADGTITYSHDGSSTNADSFTYTISDTNSSVSNEATVNVTVTPLKGAPVAGDIAETLAEGGTKLIDIAANVTEGDNPLDLTSLAIISAPNSGSVVDLGDGSVDYTHDGSETVSDSFTYTIEDIIGASSNVATVSLTITPVNDGPTISGTPATRVGEGGFYSFVPAATDADAGDILVFSISDKPAWADFDTATGGLTGSPGSGDAGTTTSGIVITVDDQQGQPNSTANLPAFDLSVTESFNEALFATPVVSSSTTVEGRFQANDGDSTTNWIADSADAGPSIQLDFDVPKLIYRVTLSDLPSGGRVTAGLMEFSDGSSETIPALPDNGTPLPIVFEPRRTDWIRVTLTQTTGDSGLTEIAADSALDPDQAEISMDLFNGINGSAPAGWSVTNNCVNSSSSWRVGSATIGVSPNAYTPQAYQQTGNCRGFSPEGVEVGSYSVYSVPASAIGMDLRLRVLADDTGVPNAWLNGAIGVLFGYQDDDNYYRLDISGLEGHRKLWKKQGPAGAGVFTELNTSPQNYTLGQWFNLRVVQQNDVILVYMDGEKILAVEDASFGAGSIALFCARNESCNFDNVIMLSSPGDPIVGMNIADSSGHRSGEYFVSAGGTLDVLAMVTEGAGIGGVEFVVDEGLAGAQSVIDEFEPYRELFNFTAAGDHDVRAYLLDSSLQRLPDDTEAMQALPQVGVNGIHLVGLGDSITAGLRDDDSSDDISADARNTGSGYQPVLNGLLTSDNGSKPVTVLDEGDSGETSAEAAARIGAVLDRTPAAQAYLAFYGANDSGGTTPVSKAVFKGNMQTIINDVTAAGKKIYLAKAPPHLGDTTRDNLIVQYNDAIDELVIENGFSGYTPPDFHSYFLNNQSEMFDDLHPNGTGYQSMARLWCLSLDGQAGMVCIP